LLKRSQIYNGMKTGYTNAAGRCLISSASSSGREVILVQLGSKTKYIFDDAERVMRWGLRQGRFISFY
jgi:D-alanyl-D-alanine carboxypeptidase (penicillin-binding protein 5/6)